MIGIPVGDFPMGILMGEDARARITAWLAACGYAPDSIQNNGGVWEVGITSADSGDAAKVKLLAHLYPVNVPVRVWLNLQAPAPAPAWWSALATPFQVTPARDWIPVYVDKGITPWAAHPAIGKAWGVMNVSLVDGEWLEVNPANPTLWVRGADVTKV